MCFFIRVGRVGGGFDPTPNGSLITPRRIMMNGRPSPRNLPGLQVSRAPAMGPGMPPPPPPPPYSQEQSFHGQTPGMLLVTFNIYQLKIHSQSCLILLSSAVDCLPTVPTPVPGEVNMNQEGSPPVLQDSSGVTTSMYSTADTYATTSMATPSHHRTMHHYLPQAGNAPLANDYTAMPCNLQVRCLLASVVLAFK